MSIVILGAGVVGLSAAVLLQSQYPDRKITILTKVHPAGDLSAVNDEDYASNKAGAVWSTSADDQYPHVRGFCEATYHALWQLARRPELAIMRISTYELKPERPEGWTPPYVSAFAHDFRIVDREPLFGSGSYFGVHYKTTTVNVGKYLKVLADLFVSRGGHIVVRGVRHIDEALDYDEDVRVVINCTGYGAHFLGGVDDQNVYPIRGQIVLVKAPWVCMRISMGWGPKAMTYMIPREDGTLILGGTYEANERDIQPNPRTADAIIERCKVLYPELVPADGSQLDIITTVAGLRPARKGGVRVEGETIVRNERSILLVHNYGHGGYGFVASWGCADRVYQLVEEFLHSRRIEGAGSSLAGFLERVEGIFDNASQE